MNRFEIGFDREPSPEEKEDPSKEFLSALNKELAAMEQSGEITLEQAEEKRKAAALIETGLSDNPRHDALMFVRAGIADEKETLAILGKSEQSAKTEKDAVSNTSPAENRGIAYHLQRKWFDDVINSKLPSELADRARTAKISILSKIQAAPNTENKLEIALKAHESGVLSDDDLSTLVRMVTQEQKPLPEKSSLDTNLTPPEESKSPPKQPVDIQEKQDLTPEEQQRIQRVRAGIVGRAKRSGQAEKVEDKWQFSEEFIEKARREMEEAKGGKGEKPPPESEKDKLNEVAAEVRKFLKEHEQRIDALIEEKEKGVGVIGKTVRKTWDDLGKWKIFDGVNGRVALSYGLLGAGVAVGTALPGLGAALLLGQRIFAGLSVGIGSHQLMEIGGERRFEQRQKALQKERVKIDESIEKSPNDVNLREQLEKNLAESMAMTEIESLRKVKRLYKEPEYLAVRQRYHELRARKEKENLGEWIQERNKDFDSRLKKSARGQLYRKLAATGIGTFVGAGGIGWGVQEAGEALGVGAATHIPEARAKMPAEAVVTPTPEPTVEGPLEAQQFVAPTTEDLAGVSDQELRDAKAMTIKPGGSAWEAAHRFVSEGIISQREFSEAWSNPDSMVKLADARMVHISDLHLTHAGDQVELIKGADGTYRFSVADYVKDQLRVGTAEDLHRAYEQFDRQPPQWLEDAVRSQVEGPKLGADYFEQMKTIATLEAPYPVEYWQGQNFEDYIVDAKKRWEADILYLPATVTAEFPRGIMDQGQMSRLMEWLRVRGDTVAENFINSGRVAVVLDHQPEGSAFEVVKLVSTNELKPWTQSRLIPKEVFAGL